VFQLRLGVSDFSDQMMIRPLLFRNSRPPPFSGLVSECKVKVRCSFEGVFAVPARAAVFSSLVAAALPSPVSLPPS